MLIVLVIWRRTFVYADDFVAKRIGWCHVGESQIDRSREDLKRSDTASEDESKADSL